MIDTLTCALIRRTIEETFPAVGVQFDYDEDTQELFVLIDDARVYDSDKYQELVLHLKLDVLWQKGHSDVYFGVSESKDSLRPNGSYSSSPPSVAESALGLPGVRTFDISLRNSAEHEPIVQTSYSRDGSSLMTVTSNGIDMTDEDSLSELRCAA